jgi:hypothetical protein
LLAKQDAAEFGEPVRAVVEDADDRLPVGDGQRGDSPRRAVGVLEGHGRVVLDAVNFLESHPGELEALQALMGHSKIETTQVFCAG